MVFEINEAIQNESPFFIEDEEVISLIRRGQEYENQTNGYFNPAIGKLVSLWGFHSEIPRKQMPDARSISKLASEASKEILSNFNKLHYILARDGEYNEVY